MSANYTIGSTALRQDLAQSIRGDFVWVLPFVDVDSAGAETPTDLTDCEFEFVVLERDGVSAKVELEVGDGITVVDNIVTVNMINSVFSGWNRGCAFPYYLTYTTASGFKKCLFEAHFQLT